MKRIGSIIIMQILLCSLSIGHISRETKTYELQYHVYEQSNNYINFSIDVSSPLEWDTLYDDIVIRF